MAVGSKRWRRRLIVLAALFASVLGLWIAIHRVSWLGPMLADGARAVVGPTAVAKLEDFAYALDDRWQRFWRKGETPQAYWEVPSEAQAKVPAVMPAASSSAAAPAPAPTFRPADVLPVHASWSAPGDGTWVPIVDPRRPDDAPRMFKTLLHPDKSRSWTAVAIVAIDLARVDVHLMAGRHEPESKEKEAASYARPAIIPESAHERLLAAFNGGFKATHGQHGMRVDGVTLIKPRPDGCTVAKYDDGHVDIRTWKEIAAEEASMTWWRGTPGCMVELGKTHPGLTVEENTYWGSTIDGGTVIRRSAIGISQDKTTLYVGIGDATTAPAIARAMKHAGAHSVAQLDVNWSYPKFLLYEPREPGSKHLVARPLTKGFEYSVDDYVRERSPRDFFYLTAKDPAPAAETKTP